MSLNKSIIWKLALPVPAFILVCLVVAWFVIPAMVMNNAREVTMANALQMANQFKMIRSYYTKNIIRKVKGSSDLKAAIDHASDPRAVPLPATLIHDLSRLMAKNDNRMKLYSPYPFPGRKDRVLDDFQQKAWEFLSKNPDKIYSHEEVRDGKTFTRVAIADKLVSKVCVDCHNSHPQTPKNDWQLGDVRGVLEIDSDNSSIIASADIMTDKIVLGALLAGLAIFAILFFSARSIAGGVRRISNSMEQMADGDLTVAIPEKDRQDELGQMAGSLQIFQNGLRQARDLEAQVRQQQEERNRAREETEKATGIFVSRIGGIVNTVSSASAELNATAQSMAGISEQTSREAEQASLVSQQTSGSVQSVASATEEMTSTIGEISQQVGEASSAARQAVDEVGLTGRQMEVLADTANAIGEVVDLISGIAEQTNLLALNATIESARAGEAGKGFAVVAGEVKQLASQTAKATGQISSQIADIQAATREASGSMENVAQVIGRVDEISSAIAAAMEQQSAATQEIAGSVSQASSGTQQVNENINMVSQASKEAGAASQEVMTAAGELSQQAELLKGEVDSFIAKVRTG